jgi:hypothetical protein
LVAAVLRDLKVGDLVTVVWEKLGDLGHVIDFTLQRR